MEILGGGQTPESLTKLDYLNLIIGTVLLTFSKNWEVASTRPPPPVSMRTTAMSRVLKVIDLPKRNKKSSLPSWRKTQR